MKSRLFTGRRIYWFFIVAFISVACRASSDANEVQIPQDYELTQEHAGESRDFLLHLPPAYDGTTQLPLLVVLHGGGGDAAQVRRITGLDKDADEHGFIVAYPNDSSRLEDKIFTWNAGHCCGYALEEKVDDVGFLVALIDRLLAEYAIDHTRVFIAGMSNGGMMTYRAGAELSDRIAGIAPISATIGGQAFPDGPIILPPEPERPVALIAFNGREDMSVPYDGGVGPNAADWHWDFSAAESVAFWLEANGCSAESQDEVSANGNIIISRFAGCSPGADVVLVTIMDGGHAWPGARKGFFSDEPTQDISANEMLMQFFLEQ